MVMNKQELEDLIRKYDKAETSLEDERNLLEYFNDSQTRYADESDQAQFQYFKQRKEEELSEKLTTRLDRLIVPATQTSQFNINLFLRIAAVIVFGIVAGWFLLSKSNFNDSHTVTTKSGEHTRVVLPDSSVVWLNEKTTLKYDENFNLQNRVVLLEGEAYFEVRRDASRDFIVSTGEISTKVLGTSFNLRSYPGEEDIELDVTHGKVNFGSTKRIDVNYGSGARFHTSDKSFDIVELRPNSYAWKTGVLTFQDAPLRNVIQDLERYFHVSIEAENPSSLDCHFHGTFKEPEIEEVLKVIGYSLNLTYSYNNGKYSLSGQTCELK
jgi:ferric-dicitrate binding protein FerR (iron transport regulator)